MIHYLTIWMIIGAILVFPFLKKEMVLELSYQARQQREEVGGRWSILGVMTLAIIVIVLLWPIVLGLTIYDISFFDDEEE